MREGKKIDKWHNASPVAKAEKYKISPKDCIDEKCVRGIPVYPRLHH